MSAEDALMEFLSGQGVDLSSLNAGGGSSRGKGSRVYVGARSMKMPVQKGEGNLVPGQFTTAEDDLTEDIESLATRFYALEAAELTRLQQKLFLGGFFGHFDEDKVNWGLEGDEATAAAYGKALARAANFYDAGRKLSVEDVLQAAMANTPPEALGEGGGESMHPLDVKATLDQFAPAIIGRRLKPEEVERLASAYSSIQGPGGPSFGAFAKHTLEQDFPEEALEMDLVGRQQEFLSLMKNGMF